MRLPEEGDLPDRVVLVSTQPTWGGGEAYLLTLAKGLRARRIHVILLARERGVLAERAIAEGFEVQTIRGRGLHPRDLFKLRSLLTSNTRTVLHCNDTHAFRCASVAAVGRPKVRIVTMRHTMFPVRSPWRYRLLADKVICVSNPVAEQCRVAGIPAEKISVVHAGIEQPTCDSNKVNALRKELLPDKNHRLIVAVGNLLACKGHRTLIEATAKLKDRGVLVRTVVAGEGDQRDSLEALINQLDVSSEVKLLGFRSDANDLIAAADIFANPSQLEGLCLVVATAMMLERPIVTTAVGGLVDVLGIDATHHTHQGTIPIKSSEPLATIAEPDDSQQWADQIEQLLTNPPDDSLIHKAKGHAAGTFTIDPMTDRTLTVYRELSTSQRRKSA